MNKVCSHSKLVTYLRNQIILDQDCDVNWGLDVPDLARAIVVTRLGRSCLRAHRKAHHCDERKHHKKHSSGNSSNQTVVRHNYSFISKVPLNFGTLLRCGRESSGWP